MKPKTALCCANTWSISCLWSCVNVVCVCRWLKCLNTTLARWEAQCGWARGRPSSKTKVPFCVSYNFDPTRELHVCSSFMLEKKPAYVCRDLSLFSLTCNLEVEYHTYYFREAVWRKRLRRGETQTQIWGEPKVCERSGSRGDEVCWSQHWWPENGDHGTARWRGGPYNDTQITL